MGDPKKTETHSFLNNLTKELLVLIFIRLPSSREAIRCKFVCRSWLSLISSDYFVTSGINHHRDDKNLPFTLVFLDDRKSIEYIEFLSEHGLSANVDMRFLSAGRRPQSQISLVASCGDLILCSVKDYSSTSINYYICNILTKQWIVLPPAPSGRGNFGETFGFLCEPKGGRGNNIEYEYLVLRFLPRGRSNPDQFDIEMFHGKSTKFVVTSPGIVNSFYLWTSLITCGQMLFTLNYNDNLTVNCILAFDPFNDPAQFLRIIDLPLEARDTPRICKLGVCRGHLRFAQIILQSGTPIRHPCIRIWELEDYRMGKWTLVWERVSKNKALRCRNSQNLVHVLAFHANNEDLVCLLVGYRVIVYNTLTDKVESCSCPCLLEEVSPVRLELIAYGLHVLPIAQQWWPTRVHRGFLSKSNTGYLV